MGARWVGAYHGSHPAWLVLLVVGLLGLSTQGLAAQAKTKKAATKTVVFVDSDPIGAVVVVDGKALSGRTPILLRSLGPGKHRVEIARRGYTPIIGTITASSSKPVIFNKHLTPEFVDPIFPAAQNQYRLPFGLYQIDRASGIATVRPRYPNQQIMRAVDVANGALVVASLILAAEANLNPSTSSQQNGSSVSSYLPIWIMTGVSTLSDVFLHVQKSRYLRTYPVRSRPAGSDSTSPAKRYGQAQQLLGSGELAQAKETYVTIVRDSPDSPFYPRALYQLAKIQAIEGDTLLATAELRIILSDYPAPDLYDKACKTLADLDYRAGDYRAALGYLDKMVFVDPLFPQKQIAAFRSTIEAKVKQGGGS